MHGLGRMHNFRCSPRLWASFSGYPMLYAAEVFLIIAILFFSLRLRSYNLSVPFLYDGDAIVILMYVKGMIQNGWTFTIPQLSAPYSLDAAAFPLATSFDWIVMKALSLFSSDPGIVLNVFWILTIVFTALSSTYALSLLNVSKKGSFFGGMLYALLPFVFLRNVAHLNLVYYPVPLICALAIHIAKGDISKTDNSNQICFAGYFACLIQGFNYIYFSFFSVILFFAAAIFYFTRRKSCLGLGPAWIAITLIIISTLINLTPSLVSWSRHGKPPEMGYKFPAESEIFGAKLRKMLAPHQDNPLPLLANWGKRDALAAFPNENENITVRLGLYGSAGLIYILLISLAVVRTRSRLPRTIASLGLFTFIVITVGGLGAIFNLLIVPDIRCYNRFSVFIAFFSIAASCVLFDYVFQKIQSRIGNILFFLFYFSFICLSAYDQLLDRKGLLDAQQSSIALAAQDMSFVKEIETAYPHHVSIFQLPLTGFPPLSKHERMLSYDHLRPYIWSTHLSWSWPSFSQRHRAWQDKISKLEGSELLAALAYSHFDLVWIDRYAYKDDGVGLRKDLVAAGAVETLVGVSNRYIILDLGDLQKRLMETLGADRFQRQSELTLGVMP